MILHNKWEIRNISKMQIFILCNNLGLLIYGLLFVTHCRAGRIFGKLFLKFTLTAPTKKQYTSYTIGIGTKGMRQEKYILFSLCLLACRHNKLISNFWHAQHPTRKSGSNRLYFIWQMKSMFFIRWIQFVGKKFLVSHSPFIAYNVAA